MRTLRSRVVLRTLVLAGVLLLPAGAFAQDVALLARQTVDLSVAPGIDGRIQRMIGEAVARMPAERQAAARADFEAASGPIREDLLGAIARYYATAFTPEELKALTAFYESPLGKKAVSVAENKPAAVNAEIQQQIMRVVMLLNTSR